jgi:hypothetical protein
MSRYTEINILAANRSIKSGLSEYYPTQPLVINGVKWTPAKIITALETEEAQFKEARLHRDAWHLAARALRKTIRVNHQLRLALRLTLEATHGRTSVVVASFGYSRPKRRKPNIETAARAVEKRLATRAARGTRGRRQRREIKGVVPAPATKK